jgi:hypothetical protein
LQYQKQIIMRKLSRHQLALLSYLVCVGFAVVRLGVYTNVIWVGVGYLLIGIGAFAFGTLLAKKD